MDIQQLTVSRRVSDECRAGKGSSCVGRRTEFLFKVRVRNADGTDPKKGQKAEMQKRRETMRAPGS